MQHPIAFATLATFSAVALGIFWYTRKNKRKVPTKWKAVGKVKHLCIYPLTSGYRVELPTFLCTAWGPKMCNEDVHEFYDRSLIVYKEGSCESLRGSTCAKLSVIQVEACNKEEFMLKAPNVPDILVKIPKRGTKIGEVGVFKDAKIVMLDCGEDAAKWISRYVYEKECGARLGYHDGSRRRNIQDSSYLKRYCIDYPILTNDATGMYAYLCGYSLLNQTSVNELRNKIATGKEHVSVFNFRSNIIIETFGETSYVEDTWQWVKIGDAIFYIVKPNTRCCISNIDPDTADRYSEPLSTLKTYRKLKKLTNVDMEGDDPVMGCYMGLHKSGLISVDDIVYVEDFEPLH